MKFTAEQSLNTWVGEDSTTASASWNGPFSAVVS